MTIFMFDVYLYMLSARIATRLESIKNRRYTHYYRLSRLRPFVGKSTVTEWLYIGATNATHVPHTWIVFPFWYVYHNQFGARSGVNQLI